jgi:ElaB/YqjD/DUF883 family membrane-anchored ribosome-binding protein
VLGLKSRHNGVDALAADRPRRRPGNDLPANGVEENDMADESVKDQASAAVAAVTEEAKRGAAKTAEAARERLHKVADQLGDRYQKASEDVRRGAEKASKELRRGADAAREKYDEAAKAMRQGYGRARDQAKSLTKDLNDYVQENPGKSLLAAAALGFLVGLLVRGRRNSE